MRLLLVVACILATAPAWAAAPASSEIPQIATSNLPPRGDGEPIRSKSAIVAGSWDFDDVFGGPDPQGWTSRDRTALANPPFTSVQDFVGFPAPYGPIAGSQSLWCGTDGASYPNGYGYGNNWNQIFQSRVFAVTGDVTIAFDLSYDTESGFDIVWLEYRAGGNWELLWSWAGLGSGPESWVVDAADHSGNLEFRIRFSSDGGYSDEDGIIDTNGAYILDNLTITDDSGSVDSEDFEDETVGDLATADGDWAWVAPPTFGDYAGLVDGTTVVQDAAAVPNGTNMWGFFNGSTVDYGCGGFPGQTAVPYFIPTSEGDLYIENEILSPWMPVPAGNHTSLRVSFDLYRPPYLPQQPGVMIWPQVYSMVGGVETSAGTNFIYFADDWRRLNLDLISLLDPAASQFRIGLVAVEFSFFESLCHDAAPLVDNVEVCFDDFVVTNNNDSGPGSLREVMTQAIAFGATTSFQPTVRFDIPGSTVITLASPLPDITSGIFIDGRTQPGYAGVPLIEVRGTALGGSDPGFRLVDGASSLFGLSVTDFPGDGVVIAADAATIQSCYMGVDPTKSAAGNGGAGIRVTSTNPSTPTRIGGYDPSEFNCIAENAGDGIDVQGDNVEILGNLIDNNGLLGINLGAPGIDPNDPLDPDSGPNGLLNHPVITSADLTTGDLDIEIDVPSGSGYVWVYASPFCDSSGHGEGATFLGGQPVSSGGTGPQTWNIVVGPVPAGSKVSAVLMMDSVGSSEFSPCFPASGVVTNTNDSGPGSLRQAILDVNAGLFTNIDFNIPGAGIHVIAPNSPLPYISQAVIIDARTQPGYAGAPLIELDGTNAIGVISAGLYTSPGGAEIYGLSLHSFKDEAIVLDSHNSILQACWIGMDANGVIQGNNSSGVATGCAVVSTIGGILPGQPNIIVGNDTYGVWVQGGGGIDIRGNLIYGNGDQDINLGSAGIEPNDPFDADGGPNGSQNHPLILSADPSTGVVSGGLHSTPGSWFSIDVYGTDTCHFVGHGGAEQYLGTTSVLTNASGDGAWSMNIGLFTGGLNLTATATEFVATSTSEFSPCFPTFNTTSGSLISVTPPDDATGATPATILFLTVTADGNTSVNSEFTPPPLPPGSYTGSPPVLLDITTTATYNDAILVTLEYDEAQFADENTIQILHAADGALWQDITWSRDTVANTVSGRTYSLSPFVVVGEDPLTAVEETPSVSSLLGAYPNPFNPRTTLHYELAQAGPVVVQVFDLAGRLVNTLVHEPQGIGRHEATWNGLDRSGRSVASGVYLFRVQAAGLDTTHKVALIK